MKYDYLVVGAGFFGSTFARKATDAGKTCLVIEKRDHIAGMAYTQKLHGINVHTHGAHIFHTNDENIWTFLNRFGKFNNFTNRVKALAKGRMYSFPLNMMTFNQIWGVQTPEDALKKLKEVRIPCENPRNFEEWILSMVGKEIYELFFYGYTKKQYMTEPSQLPASLVKRLPIRLVYDDNYFSTKYQGVPIGGYTNMVDNMLDGIDVEVGTDFFDIDWRSYAKHLIYSGPLDKLFNYELGELDYKTLKFEHKVFDGDYQGNAVVNHCDYETPYIRSIEAKHFEKFNIHKHYDENRGSIKGKTVVSYDVPATFEETKEPYYPLLDDKNLYLAKRYKQYVDKYTKITVGGRLGSYKYLDIDQTVGQALSLADKLLN